ncbi:ABC transporter ATP-binding protein [Paraburkholderia sp. SIMBA_050]|uniref:Carbohydrate ABC transporter ATP-binding protein, CUT1 family n=1 Tax=Paraburkholderia terricola TaxID=169427 RepID=A0A1M6TNA3_9BURK|nr:MULTISPECIES: ABC transporter ATP-binding protein [Paraburkholderia]SDO80433.1 carbohydrate ABC transporter ATP-binding protein, CUT1 family [Paraburkholderia sediminicola]SHK58369.1 carbohydrate ABC transporter ATP-binding protein, CUT1 family [Paraburkholderia terricola]
MVLELERVTVVSGGQTHLYGVDLRLVPGAINVLLGPTQAGKTTLMRVMAGLDKPATGRVLADGRDVTGVSVRQRNLAMVYQQFINYPAMTVFDNIASPLKLQKTAAEEVTRRVNEVAARLHIEHLLQRRPAELSGGQQQRCALARALVKRASLVLLDEPLVNLDYKLREELRVELATLFADGKTTVVYATTEPLEALLLGGYTAIVDKGRVLQHGPTLDVYNAPASVEVAAVFNDPPMNMLVSDLTAQGTARLPIGIEVPVRQAANGAGTCRIGIRPGHLRLAPRTAQSVAVPCRLELAELSGSETFLHLHTHTGGIDLIAQLQGVHQIELGTQLDVFIDPDELFIFGADTKLLSGPEATHGAH